MVFLRTTEKGASVSILHFAHHVSHTTTPKISFKISYQTQFSELYLNFIVMQARKQKMWPKFSAHFLCDILSQLTLTFSFSHAVPSACLHQKDERNLSRNLRSLNYFSFVIKTDILCHYTPFPPPPHVLCPRTAFLVFVLKSRLQLPVCLSLNPNSSEWN